MIGRRAIAAGIAIAALAAAPAWGAAVPVPVGDNWFGHDTGHDGGTEVHELTVRRGTLVRWIWVGVARHNVTAVSGPRRFHSRTQAAGTYLWRARVRGTYRLVCTIHGRADQSMVLRVR